MSGETFLQLLGGLGTSFLLWTAALVLALVGGLGVALGKMSRRPWLRGPATLWVEAIRGVPLIVLTFWIYFGLPSDVLQRFGIPLGNFPAAVLALGCCYSAFVGETYRAGIQSVDRGQTEAGLALGLDGRAVLRRVVLPQAIRNILPALGNEAISLFKDTAIASVIAVNELMQRARDASGRSFRVMDVFTVAALLYLGVTLLLSLGQRSLERRLGAAHLDPGHH